MAVRRNPQPNGIILREWAASHQLPGAGYVELQTVPFRGHSLLADAVLRHCPPGGSVFEGGVSSGYFAQVLRDHGLVVDGAEIDPDAAAKARAACRKVIVGDLAELDLSDLVGDYDALVFGDTLEHLVDPVSLLSRLKPRLNPEGVLVVSVPNIANWAIRASLLAGRFRYTDRGILDRTHVHFYTVATLREMLGDAGYEVTEVHGAIPIPGITSAFLCKLGYRIGNLRPSLFAYGLVVVARPRHD
jgi:2-polyprenyl-3-methyl-5-hydroxy-6-metoxy-1,4-benzoquinol methylase